MNIHNVIKLDKSQDIIIDIKNSDKPQLHEYMNPFLILAKHYLFESNFEKAEELVTFFIPVLTESVIRNITDVILRQFIIKISSECGDTVSYNINGKNERLLYDFINYATDDNIFPIRQKYVLPELTPLLPKHFMDANPNAPEIALNFLKSLNLFNSTKNKKFSFKYVMDYFVKGLEMEKNEINNYFLDGLFCIVLKIFKGYKEKRLKVIQNNDNLLQLPLTRNTFSKYIKMFLNAELNESGALTTLLDDNEFYNELKRVCNLLADKDFIDLSLSDKLSIIEILQVLITEMGLLNDIRKNFEKDSNISNSALREKTLEKQRLEKKISNLEKEIVSFEDGKMSVSDGQSLRFVLDEKRKQLRNWKKDLVGLEAICVEMEDRKKYADFILWNKLPNILGRDRKFNIFNISLGFDFIYVMKPKNAKYATIKKEYSKTYNQNCTVNDELIAKLSPITKMKCDGYEYFYIDSIKNLENIHSILDGRGVRERELLRSMDKIMDIAKFHIESYQNRV